MDYEEKNGLILMSLLFCYQFEQFCSLFTLLIFFKQLLLLQQVIQLCN